VRVFVTGGAGYIGRVVTAALLGRGHDVVVYDTRGSASGVAVRAEAVRPMRRARNV
jgi:nucleoside-diphosphate-sugar epimerase